MPKRTKIVAEISGNHNGSIDRACQLILTAHQCGADLVKIQIYEEDSLTIDSTNDEFMIKGGLWDGYSYYQLYQKAKTPRAWAHVLFDFAKAHNITLFASPFAPCDVDVLEKENCPIYKIASFEFNYLDLIEYVAQTKKPMVLSTGMADLKEIDRVVELLEKNRVNDYTLLVCQSQYPAAYENFNLSLIPFFKDRYKCKVGLSDHALGDKLDIAACAMGADMIEKHFTADRSLSSVDAQFSMDIADLKELVSDIKLIEQSIKEPKLQLSEDDLNSRYSRRSIYLIKNKKAGEIIKEDDIKVIRPALGLDPFDKPLVLNKKCKYDLVAPCPLAWDMLE